MGADAAACDGRSSSSTPPARAQAPTASASALAQLSSDAGGGGKGDRAHAIDSFAAARGGLHKGQFAVLGASPNSKRALFFVGGDAAHAAWLATAACPPTCSPTFTRVRGWPRAVRVLDAVPFPAPANAREVHPVAAVVVESLPARDQPGGLGGVLVVSEGGDDVWTSTHHDGEWHWAGEAVGQELLARLASLPPALSFQQHEEARARLARASKSAGALAEELGPSGVDVFEIWQESLVRKVEHVTAATVSASPRLDALRGLVGRLSQGYDCWHALCAVGVTPNSTIEDEGATFALEGDEARLRALFLSDKNRPLLAPKETEPAPAMDDAVLETYRFAWAGPGTARVLVQADVGAGRRVGVVQDPRGAWIVEREGPYSTVQQIEETGTAPIEARIVDLDGDGVADVLVLDRTSAPAPRVLAYLRGTRAAGAPSRDWLGVEVAMVGASSLDEAVHLAHAPRAPVRATRADVCALASRASTLRGLRRAATPDARVVFFGRHEQPGFVLRILSMADVKEEQIARLHGICDSKKVTNGGQSWRVPGKAPPHDVSCDDRSLCGDWEWAAFGEVRDYLRLVRVEGALEIDMVFLQEGDD